MATKLPELAVVLSLIMLGQRLSGYENRPMGYLLIAVGTLLGIQWLHSLYGHFSRKEGAPASFKKLRLPATWITVVALIIVVNYPLIVIHRTEPLHVPESPGGRSVQPTPVKLDAGVFSVPKPESSSCVHPIAFTELPVQSDFLPYSKRISIRTLADREMKLRWFWKGHYFAGTFNGPAIDGGHSYMDNTTITLVLKATGRMEEIVLSSDRPLDIECIDQLKL